MMAKQSGQRPRHGKGTVTLPGGATREFTVGPDVDLEREVVHDRGGNRIDQAYVDAAVRDIDRYVGRPSLTSKGVRSPQIGVRLPAALKAALEARAKREGKSPSEIARVAIEQYVAS